MVGTRVISSEKSVWQVRKATLIGAGGAQQHLKGDERGVETSVISFLAQYG